MKVKFIIYILIFKYIPILIFFDWFELKFIYWDPKDSDLCLRKVKSEEILMEACKGCWRANRSSNLSIGAKD